MTSILGNTRRPDIKFHTDGKIEITSTIARALSIGRGDVIDVIEHKGEYYLVVRLRADKAIGRHEAQCFPTNKNKVCRNFRAYSKKLSAAILNITGGVEARLPSGEPQYIEPYGIAIPLITRNNMI